MTLTRKTLYILIALAMVVTMMLASVMPAVFADESEPNDSAGTADALTPPSDADWGNIAPAGDIDWWVMGGASINDLVFVYIDATGSTDSTDSVLNVTANDQTTLIEDDDDGGPGLSSVVAGAIVPQAGDVYFMIREFGVPDPITPYGIYAAVLDPATDSVAETEPNDTAGTATPITLLRIVNASLPGGDAVDFFSFHASAGDVIAVSMDDDPNDDWNLFDSELDILGTDGTTVLAAGDDGSNAGNAAGAVTIPADGTYYVRASDGGGGDGDTDYRFVIHGLPYWLPPPAVPTLSQWGMIAMGLLFAALLIWSVRRRWVVSADRSAE